MVFSLQHTNTYAPRTAYYHNYHKVEPISCVIESEESCTHAAVPSFPYFSKSPRPPTSIPAVQWAVHAMGHDTVGERRYIIYQYRNSRMVTCRLGINGIISNLFAPPWLSSGNHAYASFSQGFKRAFRPTSVQRSSIIRGDARATDLLLCCGLVLGLQTDTLSYKALPNNLGEVSFSV
jgi:hypothetical protein